MDETPLRRLGRRLSSSNLTILILLALIFVAFSLLTPSGTFLSRSNVESIALAASELLIVSSGVTFLLIAAGIDLSVGSVLGFSGVVAALIMSTMTADLADPARTGAALWGPVALGVLAALVAGSGLGVVNGLIVVMTNIPSMIATLATSTIVLGLSQILTGGVNVGGAPVELQDAFGLGSVLGVPWPVATATFVVAVLWILMAQTQFGLRNYAIGANAEAARRAGINVKAHLVTVYGMVGFLAGLAGTIDVARFTTATINGFANTPLQAITAAVIGGTSLWGGRGRMLGTVVGAFIPATLTSGFVVMGVQPFWQNVAIGVVLLLAVWLDQYRRSLSTRR